MNRPVSSESASLRLRSGRRWIRPITWNGGIAIIACSGTLGVRRSGRASIEVSRDREQHRAEIDLGVLGSGREVPRSVLVDHRVAEDEEVLVRVVEDVRDPRLAGPDLALDHEAVGVEGQGNHEGFAAHQVEHGRRIRVRRGREPIRFTR